jgi:hypothetical protein
MILRSFLMLAAFGASLACSQSAKAGYYGLANFVLPGGDGLTYEYTQLPAQDQEDLKSAVGEALVDAGLTAMSYFPFRIENGPVQSGGSGTSYWEQGGVELIGYIDILFDPWEGELWVSESVGYFDEFGFEVVWQCSAIYQGDPLISQWDASSYEVGTYNWELYWASGTNWPEDIDIVVTEGYEEDW